MEGGNEVCSQGGEEEMELTGGQKEGKQSRSFICGGELNGTVGDDLLEQTAATSNLHYFDKRSGADRRYGRK